MSSGGAWLGAVAMVIILGSWAIYWWYGFCERREARFMQHMDAHMGRYASNVDQGYSDRHHPQRVMEEPVPADLYSRARLLAFLLGDDDDE